MSAAVEQGTYCDRCGWWHQDRERVVKCLACSRRFTANFHAVCDSCIERGA